MSPSRRLWILVGLLILVAAIAVIRLDSPKARRQAASSRALESLPYLTWVPAGETLDKRGVTFHDTDRVAPGLNLYAPRNAHRAVLVDMDGETVHQWDRPIRAADTWQHVELLPGGELVVVVSEQRLVALNRDSTVRWVLEQPVHHDVAIAPSGGLYVLTQDRRSIRRSGNDQPILSDSILRLSADGTIEGRLDLLDLFVDRLSEERWADLDQWLAKWAGPAAQLGPQVALKSGSPADLFHANSLEVLPRDVEAIGRRGDLLVSLRDIDTIAVVDFESGTLGWSWGAGTLRRQHHPTLLDNDNLLVFDNLGGPTQRSRVIELDPRTGAIVWSYSGDPPESFFSALRGGSQRLSNGNTLVTESDRGRVFEVTPAGDTVWEYYNPVVSRTQKKRSAIYRMTRIESSELSWLD